MKKTAKDILVANAWRWKCGLEEEDYNSPTGGCNTKLTYDSLAKSEWSKEFEQLMRNRLIMGALRYGVIGKVDKPEYDRIPSMIKRIQEYARTHNTEYLVDVANLCLLEFVEGNHPDKHFASIDDGEHVQVKHTRNTHFCHEYYGNFCKGCPDIKICK